MTQPLVRSVGAAAIVWTTYVAYSMIAVPLIEPEVRPKPVDAPTAAGSGGGSQANQQDDMLAELFPEGSWPREHPKVVETDQAMLLFGEYKNRADGTVSLWPCAMIFFRDGKDGKNAAQEAIVLDAPDGATLRFDQPFDLGRANVGRLEAGHLLGKIKIYSRRDPGPEDDVMITTRDVQLAPDRIWTPHPVDFRFGASYGSGTELRIHLLPRPDGTPRPHGPSVGGIRSIELAHEVKMHLNLGRRNWMPSDRTARDAVAMEPANPESRAKSPPIEITCRGPFEFDVVDSVATFHEQVNVLQIHDNGQSDKLLSEVLSLNFASPDKKKKPSSAGALSGLVLAGMEAKGHPVIVHSPSTTTDARCQSLRFDVKENRLRLSGQSGVWLKREASEVTAGSIDYVGATAGRLGTLLAIGPGRIDAKFGENQDQPFSAEWQQRLQIQPYNGYKVVSLVGGARSSSSSWGTLAADELHVYLSEIGVVDEGSSARDSEVSKYETRPDALKAVGRVQIDSPQLVGSTEDLVLWINHLPPAVVATDPSSPRARPNAFDPRPTPATANSEPKDRYKIHGGSIQVQLVTQTRGLKKKRHTEVANVVVKNRAYFAEVPLPGDQRTKSKEPLVVQGHDLRVDHANSPDMLIAVQGEPAHIEARGMSLDGGQINMDRRKNRLWVDRAGKLTLPVARDLDGRALATRDQLMITWSGGMDFDGMTMRFKKDVSAATSHQSLATDAMAVTMTERVNFGSSDTRQKIDVYAVRCQGQVRLQSETLDKKGQRESWLRAVADNLVIEQATGKLTADGPGWIKIVRRGAVDTTRANLGAATNRSTAVSDRFSYLGIDFQRSLTGNILPGRRRLIFTDQIKTVFGPVDRWADELDTARRVAARPDNVLLSCDQLTVSQLPARSGVPASFDLAAVGGTRVEGKDFAAMASRLTYAEGKDLLILDSDGLSDAKLFRDDDQGGRSELVARQIHYWPRSQKFRVFGARSVRSVAGRP